MADVQIYGSGDGHSLELRGMLVNAGYHVEFRDIRGQTGAEHRGFLIDRGLSHVPQVFRADGRHVGDYESALVELGL